MSWYDSILSYTQSYMSSIMFLSGSCGCCYCCAAAAADVPKCCCCVADALMLMRCVPTFVPPRVFECCKWYVRHVWMHTQQLRDQIRHGDRSRARDKRREDVTHKATPSATQGTRNTNHHTNDSINTHECTDTGKTRWYAPTHAPQNACCWYGRCALA